MSKFNFIFRGHWFIKALKYRAMPSPIYQLKLLSRCQAAFETATFEFEKPAGFEFKPGQFIDMTLIDVSPTDEKGNNRDFSLSLIHI